MATAEAAKHEAVSSAMTNGKLKIHPLTKLPRLRIRQFNTARGIKDFMVNEQTVVDIPSTVEDFEKMKIANLLGNERIKPVLEKHIPGFTTNPGKQMAKEFTLFQLANIPQANISEGVFVLF